MDTNSLGTDQLQASVIGLGCNNFGRSGSATETLAGTRAVIDELSPGARSASSAAPDSTPRRCAELGQPMVHVAFAWLLGKPVVSSVIAGATRAERVRQNAAAAGVRLDAETMSRLDEMFSVDLSAS